MAHRVAVLALDRVVPFVLGIPARVFGAARGAKGEPLYEVVTCSIGGAPVPTSADFTIVVDRDESALAEADTAIVAMQDPEGRLRDEGVLADEVATALATVRPDARLVAISAGGAAGVDLCLHIVRSDHGSDVANAAARRCVVPPWREGGQAQFIEHPVPAFSTASTAATREWALARLHTPLTLAELAGHAQMSVRTFTRRFRAEVGMSPSRWIAQQRVDRARALLETTDLPVETVAREAGFGGAALLRLHLRAAIGVSPQTYRRTFQAPVPA